MKLSRAQKSTTMPNPEDVSMSSVRKTLAHFVEYFGDGGVSKGDISLAGFLLNYGFTKSAMSVGAIGSIPRLEAIALNAMLAADASLIVLAEDTLSHHRNISEIVSEIEANGFDPQLQFADLTLRSRWPHILSAMARTDLGIIGIDARWAARDPDFWKTLQHFMLEGRAVVYIRNILDYRHPETAIGFLRSMPSDYALSVIAATPRSVWFAADEAQGSFLRELLGSSGLFPQAEFEDISGSPAVPIVVADERVLRQIDAVGRMPRVAISTTSQSAGGIDYLTGWSDAEDDGCWTAGPDAALRVTLPPRSGRPQSLAITGNSWIPPNVKGQVVSIGIGTEPTAWAKTSFVESDEILTVRIPLDNATYDPSNVVIRFKVQSPGRPSDFGGADTRLLGFKIRNINVFTGTLVEG